MFSTADGDEVFIIDGHVHLWDGSPANQRNIHGAQFINCFHDYHKGLSPAEYVWPMERFYKYEPATMYRDLFVDGYDDMAICQPTYLTDFYKSGFNTTEQNARMKELYPERIILNGAFDPREGEGGLEYLESLVEKYRIKGVKLYTAEWRGDSKGYKLSDRSAYRYLEKCQELGVRNIHVHKGPTILPPRPCASQPSWQQARRPETTGQARCGCGSRPFTTPNWTNRSRNSGSFKTSVWTRTIAFTSAFICRPTGVPPTSPS